MGLFFSARTSLQKKKDRDRHPDVGSMLHPDSALVYIRESFFNLLSSTSSQKKNCVTISGAFTMSMFRCRAPNSLREGDFSLVFFFLKGGV